MLTVTRLLPPSMVAPVLPWSDSEKLFDGVPGSPASKEMVATLGPDSPGPHVKVSIPPAPSKKSVPSIADPLVARTSTEAAPDAPPDRVTTARTKPACA